MLNAEELRLFADSFPAYAEIVLKPIVLLTEIDLSLSTVVRNIIGYMMEDGLFSYRHLEKNEELREEVKIAILIMLDSTENKNIVNISFRQKPGFDFKMFPTYISGLNLKIIIHGVIVQSFITKESCEGYLHLTSPETLHDLIVSADNL